MAGVSPIFRWTVVVTAAIWVLFELRQSLARRPEAVKASWSSELLFRLIVGVSALVAGLLAEMARSAKILPAADAVWIGLALLWAGIGLRLWSFHTLGRYFTPTLQASGDQQVITHGPYRVIRHPSYAGLLLVIIAVALFIGNWWSLLCLTVGTAVGIVFRIRVEERALMHNLGTDYRSYAASHKRLVPFLW